MSMTVKCRQHPQYMAKRQPRVECPTCWMLYELALGELFADPCSVGRGKDVMQQLHTAFSGVGVVR